MQAEHAAAIKDKWLQLTGTGPEALRTFLIESIPDVGAWAVRWSPSSAGRDPEILALTTLHLYSVVRCDVDGAQAFGFERWQLDRTEISRMVEWREAGMGDETLHRRWTIRRGDDAVTLDTQQTAGGAFSDLERLLRLVLERAG